MKNLPILGPRLPEGHELVPTYGGFRRYRVALFSVVNPVGDAPMFLALTKPYPQSVRQKLAGKIAFYGFMLPAVSFLFGTLILDSGCEVVNGPGERSRTERSTGDPRIKPWQKVLNSCSG